MGTGQIREALTNPTLHQDLRASEDPLQELTRKREQLECIVNRSPAVAFRRRGEEGWPVEFVSENIRQFGYSPEDFYSGRITYCNIIHPDDLKRVTTELSQCNRQQVKGVSVSNIELSRRLEKNAGWMIGLGQPEAKTGKSHTTRASSWISPSARKRSRN
jgi:hypothetical protein